MDVYLELFGDTPMQRVVIPGGQTNGHIRDPRFEEAFTAPLPSLNESQSSFNQDYSEEYRREEDRRYEASWQASMDLDNQSSADGDLEQKLSEAESQQQLMEEQHSHVLYQRYNFKHTYPKLGISEYKDDILHAVESNPTVIIEGYTGCGKSTQVPQMILDNERQKGRHCNIIVTQPRRIAATSIANHVARQRGWPLGSLVGYKVALDKAESEDTRLSYCTTGVLLQSLMKPNAILRYTHIFIDEVHERDQEMDFLLLMVRYFQRTRAKKLKVILMSATFNTQQFATYFYTYSDVEQRSQSAPVISVKYTPIHKVHTYYIEDLSQLRVQLPRMIKGPIRGESPSITREHHLAVVELIIALDKIRATTLGAVLVFLPGIHEIESLYNILKQNAELRKWWLLPLHSSIMKADQMKVFQPPPSGTRKIILATNIAESSITVPDIVYIIDYCMTKQLRTEETTNFSSLQLVWASQANLKQRAGRTGRVCEGRVYRLIYKSDYDKLMDEQEPEMLRCPLERLVLLCKELMPRKKPKELLALALDPPFLGNIENTILLLKEVGGLLTSPHDTQKTIRDDGQITYLGRIMAHLPLDICIAKLIALGHVFGVFYDCVIMGAAMSVKNMFTSRFQQQLDGYVAKLAWSDSSCSDPIAFLNAFKVWEERHRSGYFHRSQNPYAAEQEWANRSFLQLRALHEISDLVNDLMRRLNHLGMTDVHSESQQTWRKEDLPLIHKIVIAGAFYPNYFVRSHTEGREFEKSAVRALVGRDPYCSVYLEGMPQDHPGDIYTARIREMLKPYLGKNVKISFDDTKKIYLEFPPKGVSGLKTDGLPFVVQMPGRVAFSVYRAIKIRQINNIRLELRVLPSEQAQIKCPQLRKPQIMALSGPSSADRNEERQREIDERWSSGGVKFDSIASKTTQPQLPELDTTVMQIRFCPAKGSINPCQFWVFDAYENVVENNLRRMYNALNTRENLPSPQLTPLAPSEHRMGRVVAAPYEGSYYRARIISLSQHHATVFFIDYGNTEEVLRGDLRGFSRQLIDFGVLAKPEMVLECRLAECAPTQLSDSGQWTQEALQYFTNLVDPGSGRTFYAEIFSVVNSVVAIKLIHKSVRDPVTKEVSEIYVNDMLVEKQYAQKAVESHLSQCNHEIREKAVAQFWTKAQKDCYEQQQYSELDVLTHDDPPPPHLKETTRLVRLRGPTSPLEMQVVSLVRSSESKSVNMDQDSVNSVLIDDDPLNPCDKMVVAASISASDGGCRLTARQTTIMPSVPGLSALICLMFCPRMELRISPDESAFIGALIGLGCDNDNNALYPHHDFELTFDSKFTLDDIYSINQLRREMNNALALDANAANRELCSDDIARYQNNVYRVINRLLLKQKREPKEKIYYVGHNYKWGRLDPSRRLVTSNHSTPGRQNDVFKLLDGYVLEDEGAMERREFEANLALLKEVARSGRWNNEERCSMCRTRFYCLTSLRLHLVSDEHLENERQKLGLVTDFPYMDGDNVEDNVAFVELQEVGTEHFGEEAGAGPTEQESGADSIELESGAEPFGAP